MFNEFRDYRIQFSHCSHRPEGRITGSALPGAEVKKAKS